MRLSGKEPAYQYRRRKRFGFDPWVRKIPWGRARQLTPVFLPGESQGQRSLAGCSPWGLTGSDTTERLPSCFPFPIHHMHALLTHLLASPSFPPRLLSVVVGSTLSCEWLHLRSRSCSLAAADCCLVSCYRVPLRRHQSRHSTFRAEVPCMFFLFSLSLA